MKKVIYKAAPDRLTEYRPTPRMNRAKWIAAGAVIAVIASAFLMRSADAAHITPAEVEIQNIIQGAFATGYPASERVLHDKIEQEALDYLRSEPPITKAIEGGIVRNSAF